MEFEVKNNKLVIAGQTPETVLPGVSKVSDGENPCDYIIYHYTASGTAQSAINNLLNKDSKVSWHLTIDRNGKVYSHYPFNKITWHAGKSGWKEGSRIINGMNPVSIGIEMVNWGPLTLENGGYHSWTGTPVYNTDVFFDKNGNAWHKYTDIQLAVATEVGKALIKAYNPLNVLGHQHISPGRKMDPGPAFAATLNSIRRFCGLPPI